MAQGQILGHPYRGGLHLLHGPMELKLDGCQQTEIAAELGVSPAFVSQRLRAIRQRWDARAVA